MGANREYKDSVFTKLFSDPEKLLELYNAIEGSDYGSDAKLEINTLEDVLFLEQLNDISFTIDEKLVVLVEHQASVNANMPLRILMYIARVYEKLIDDRAIYKQGLIKIPTPEFIVLYNGKDSFPEEHMLRLSDAFIEKSAAPCLDLTVRVLNINQGYNERIVKKSETLEGYVTFIARVRENKNSGMDLAESITEAVKYCTDKHILQRFLTKHSSEVLNMLTTEFRLEDAIAVRAQEAREEGKAEGEAVGEARGKAEGEARVLALLKQGYLLNEIEDILSKEMPKS